MLIDQTVFPLNLYVEALTPGVTAFGDRAFRDETEVMWSQGDPEFNMTRAVIGREMPEAHTRGEAM